MQQSRASFAKTTVTVTANNENDLDDTNRVKKQNFISDIAASC